MLIKELREANNYIRTLEQKITKLESALSENDSIESYIAQCSKHLSPSLASTVKSFLLNKNQLFKNKTSHNFQNRIRVRKLSTLQ